MWSSTPFVVNSISRYARRRSSVDSTPMESKRFLIVPLLSSAARMPLPGATSARAVAFSSLRSMRSLPFNGAGWFARDVVGDPIHAGHLVDDPRCHALEHVGRKPGPIGGHRVLRRDRADDDRVLVRAAVAHHADGPHCGEHRKALPDLAVEAGAADLLDHDGVGAAQ